MNIPETLKIIEEQRKEVEKLFEKKVVLPTLTGDEFPWQDLAVAYSCDTQNIVTLVENLWAISVQTATAAYLKGYKDAKNKKSIDELETMFNK